MIFIAIAIAVFLTSSSAYVAIAPDQRTLRASRGAAGALRAGGSAAAETVRAGWGSGWARTGSSTRTVDYGGTPVSTTSETFSKTPTGTRSRTGKKTGSGTPRKTRSRTPKKTPSKGSGAGGWRTGYRRARTGVRRARVLVRALRTGYRAARTGFTAAAAAAVAARQARQAAKASRTPEEQAQVDADKYWWRKPKQDYLQPTERREDPSERPTPTNTGGPAVSTATGEYTGPSDIQADVDQAARLAEEAAAAQAAAAAAIAAMEEHVAGMVGKYEGGGESCPRTSALSSSLVGLQEGGGSEPQQVLDLLPAVADAVTEAQGLGENVATIGAEGDTASFKDS